MLHSAMGTAECLDERLSPHMGTCLCYAVSKLICVGIVTSNSERAVLAPSCVVSELAQRLVAVALGGRRKVLTALLAAASATPKPPPKDFLELVVCEVGLAQTCRRYQALTCGCATRAAQPSASPLVTVAQELLVADICADAQEH